MTQYNSLNVKLSNPQFNKWKTTIKNETGVNLTLSSNMVGEPNDEINSSHKLLVADRQVWKLRKAFAKSSGNLKLPKSNCLK